MKNILVKSFNEKKFEFILEKESVIEKNDIQTKINGLDIAPAEIYLINGNNSDIFERMIEQIESEVKKSLHESQLLKININEEDKKKIEKGANIFQETSQIKSILMDEKETEKVAFEKKLKEESLKNEALEIETLKSIDQYFIFNEKNHYFFFTSKINNIKNKFKKLKKKKLIEYNKVFDFQVRDIPNHKNLKEIRLEKILDQRDIVYEKIIYKTLFDTEKSVFINSHKMAKKMKVKIPKTYSFSDESKPKPLKRFLSEISYLLANKDKEDIIDKVFAKNRKKIEEYILLKNALKRKDLNASVSKMDTKAAKIFSIIYWQLKTKEKKKVMEIFGRYYPDSTNYINSRTTLDLEKYVKEKFEKQFFNLPEFNENISILFALCFLLDKEIIINNGNLYNEKDIVKKEEIEILAEEKLEKFKIEYPEALKSKIYSSFFDETDLKIGYILDHFFTKTATEIIDIYLKRYIKENPTVSLNESHKDIAYHISVIDSLLKALNYEKKNNNNLDKEKYEKIIENKDKKIEELTKSLEKEKKINKKNNRKLMNFKKEIDRTKESKDKIKKEKTEITNELYFLKNEFKKIEKKEIEKLKEEDRLRIIEDEGIFFAGRPETQLKLKSRLPNFKFIEHDKYNFDTNVTNKYKHIFYGSNYGGHALLKRVNSSLNSNQEFHTIEFTNTDLIVKIIHEEINK